MLTATIILTALFIALRLVKAGRKSDLEFWEIQQQAASRLGSSWKDQQTRRDAAADRGAEVQWHQEKGND